MNNALIDKYTSNELQTIAYNSNCLSDFVLKLGYSTYNGSNFVTVKKRINKYGIDTSHFGLQEKKERNHENVFCKDSDCTQKVLREHFKKISDDNACEICGQSKIWNGKSLTMILDHKNGDKHDNRIENLRWTCPNCGSQLSTFAGRNRKTKK